MTAGRAGRRVTFGVGLYTGQSASAAGRFGDLPGLAAAAEEAGFDTFWVSEHHGWPDGYLPSPLVALAAAAQATSTITLATGVVVGPLHHPLRLAEDAVVVDHLSGGRLLLGLAGGYMTREFADSGVALAERGARLEDTVAMLRLAWRGEPFDYRGRHFSVDGARVTPAALRSGIPVWLGGYAPGAVERAGRLADGHLVGRGRPDMVGRAAGILSSVRDPGDAGFTFGLNVAVVVDHPDAHPDSARRAFAAQQAAYEAVQAGTDVYAGHIAAGGRPDGLAEGDIASYIQAQGSTESVVAGLAGTLESLADWASVHLALRIVFPDEDPAAAAGRLAFFGREILPPLRELAGDRRHRNEGGTEE